MLKKIKGLGDIIEKFTKITGIKKLRLNVVVIKDKIN